MLSSPSLRLLAPPPRHYSVVRSCQESAGGRSAARSEPCRQENIPRRSISLGASASILLWSFPVNAGVLSGFSGLESVPGPELPQIDFLNRWNEEKRKKYEELDSRFRSSTVLKELLEKSKQNKERNKRAIEDKYCLRGAEWGVGDCSTDGMTQEEKEAFIDELKKRTVAENYISAYILKKSKNKVSRWR